MSKTLYVPVMLDVLLVGDEDRGYADVDYDYSLLDEETLFGDMISNRGFGEKKQLAGAHLQWTMPDALLHGVKQEDGSISFPTPPESVSDTKAENGWGRRFLEVLENTQ